MFKPFKLLFFLSLLMFRAEQKIMTEISLLPVSGIYLEQFYSVFYFFSHSDNATQEW